MKTLSQSRVKQTIRAIFILLVGIGGQEAYASEIASVFIETIIPVSSSIIVLLPNTNLPVCPLGETCSTDGVWTQWQLPTLQAGQPVSLSTASTGFDFYLGNTLNGQFGVSLTPAIRIPAYPTAVDELTANIASRSSIFSTTNYGFTSFQASSGTDYYLFLTGQVDPNLTYQLQVNQIPLPAAFWLFGTGLTAFLAFKKKRVQSKWNGA